MGDTKYFPDSLRPRVLYLFLHLPIRESYWWVLLKMFWFQAVDFWGNAPSTRSSLQPSVEPCYIAPVQTPRGSGGLLVNGSEQFTAKLSKALTCLITAQLRSIVPGIGDLFVSFFF